MSHRDDPTITDSEEIRPDQIVKDENLKRLRPSTAAFEDSSDGSPMSVQLSEVVRSSGGNAETALAGYDGYALAGFTAGFARQECKQGVEREPLQDDPAHAYVFGKKTDGVKKKFARNSRWVVALPVSR